MAPALLDWAKLTPELREQLFHFMPLEIKGQLAVSNDPSAHTLRAIHAHLAYLLKAIDVMVPRWVRDSIDDSAFTQVRAFAATLLFADVTGFTPLTAQLETFGRIGNEHITHALNRFFAAVVPIALARQGDLLAFGGDAILVAFGGPDHAVTAAVAAWEMQQAIASLDIGNIGLPNPPRLQMKIGLASGPLLLSSIGTAFRRVALPLGSVLDTTDAMANTTAPGQVRLDTCAAAGAAPIAHLAPQPDGSALLMGLQDIPSRPHKRAAAAIPASISDLVRRIAALAPYLPESVLASLIAAPRAAPGYGERRYVVNLFAHLIGLHALADALWSQEPDLVSRMADLALNRALALIEGHGGVLARVDIYPRGHKLLALFGAPVAHEQEAERAILAALALRDAIPQINAEIAACLATRGSDLIGAFDAQQPGLTFRSGINAGPVVAGLVGSPLRREYTVMGDAANVAARLMSNAQPGEVLASAGVGTMARDLLDAEGRTLTLKGKREPVPVWSVRALQRASRPRELQDAPLVGRESEQEVLRGIGEGLSAGHAWVVFVQGEAGIGKSRLVRELPALLGANIACVQTGSPGLVPINFGLFRAFLLELCQVTLEASTAPDVEQLHAAVERLCPGQIAEIWPALTILIGVSDPAQAASGATAETQQRILAWAVQSIVTAAAAQQPLAWICEDIHDADDASLAVLEQLLTIGWGVPMLFCATLRATAATTHTARRLVETAARRFQSNALSLELGEIGLDAGDQLLDSLLPGLAPSARAALHAHATGNPLFLQVLAQRVQQQRLLVASSQGLALRGSLVSLDIPRTLRELVAAQVDRLPAEARRLAQVAAVIAVADRTVPLWLLEQIVDERRTIAPRLRALEQAQVIAAEAAEPAPRYVFRHALYQQAAYEQLLERERRELHRRAGLALHERREQHEARVEALAYHCYEGQCWELAVDYSLAAGQRALRAYANREARRLLRRAQGLARRLGQAEQEADAREGLGELYLWIGNYNPARSQLQRSLNHSDAAPDNIGQVERRARRFLMLSQAAEATGAYNQAEEECRAGLALARYLPQETRVIPRLYEQLAIVQMRRGELGLSEATCREGLSTIPHGLALEAERVALLQLMGNLDFQRGHHRAAVQALEQSLALARPLNDPTATPPILRNLGLAYYSTGNRARALECYRESLAIDERIGNIVGLMRALDNMALVFQVNGEYETAREYFQKCLRLTQDHSMASIEANVLTNLGWLDFITGDHKQALIKLQRAYDMFSEMQELWGLADCCATLGNVALARGEVSDALNYGQQTLTHACEAGSILYQAYGHRIVGETLLAEGRVGDAAAALNQAQQLQVQIDDPSGEIRLMRAFALLECEQRQEQESRDLAQRGLALACEYQMPYLIAQMEQLLERLPQPAQQ